MKKILITGSSGMLGSNLVSCLKNKNNLELFGFSHTKENNELRNQFKVDLTDFNSINRHLNFIKPDILIHCAAMSNVDLCEKNISLANKINAQATENIVKNISNDVRFIYISTDSVFNGKKGNYREEDTPMPLNCYAKTKLKGENYIKKYSRNYLIIRTIFFGHNRIKGESFAEWIVNSLEQRKKINMFIDVLFSPIYVLTLSMYIEKLLNCKTTGILNLASQDSMSKYDFGVSLADRLNLDKGLINPISIEEFNFIAKRPKNISLDPTKAKGEFGEMPTIKEEINKFAQWKNGI